MTVKASKEAGFSKELQSNNVPGGINALIKRWQDFTASDMHSFIEQFKSLVEKQQNDVVRAFLGLPGPYKVRKEYQHCMVDSTNFFYAQNDVMRQSMLKK